MQHLLCFMHAALPAHAQQVSCHPLQPWNGALDYEISPGPGPRNYQHQQASLKSFCFSGLHLES